MRNVLFLALSLFAFSAPAHCFGLPDFMGNIFSLGKPNPPPIPPASIPVITYNGATPPAFPGPTTPRSFGGNTPATHGSPTTPRGLVFAVGPIPAPAPTPTPVTSPILTPTLTPTPTPTPDTSPTPAVPEQFKGHAGRLDLTLDEILTHQKRVQEFALDAAYCLQWHLQKHKDFWTKYHISAFYGTQSPYMTMTLEQKQADLKSLNVPPEIAKELSPLSCVDLSIDCLKYAFRETGQESLWQKIHKFIVDNDKDGTAVQLALQQLGWKVLYWNPDVSQNKVWDENEKKQSPDDEFSFWGYHQERYQQVLTKHQYYFNPVDDSTSLVNFGRRLPQKFMQVPFFIGTAHTGFHVFPGFNGYVIEAHSSAVITQERTIEAGPFDPLNPKEPHPDAGGYGTYLSGLIVVPPGYGY